MVVEDQGAKRRPSPEWALPAANYYVPRVSLEDPGPGGIRSTCDQVPSGIRVKCSTHLDQRMLLPAELEIFLVKNDATTRPASGRSPARRLSLPATRISIMVVARRRSKAFKTMGLWR